MRSDGRWRPRAAAVAIVTAAVLVPAAPRATAGPAAFIRVNLVGYIRDDPTKVAYVLSPVAETGGAWALENAGGTSVASGSLGASQGAWNAAYPAVYEIDFGAVTKPGRYRLYVSGPGPAVSPSIRIAGAETLYAPLVANARFFFEAQRDGADVDPSVLDRQPSHANDATATEYVPPAYLHDKLQADLTATGRGPVDVSGGWFDAGDYVKFVETASFTDVAMLMAARDEPSLAGAGAAADFAAEGRSGIDWLMRMWDGATKTLDYQVGIGDGNGCGSICGDHDIWRLPQADDTYKPASAKYRYIRNRPVFRAAPPGASISPNLAGRVAAAFGLCAQVFHATDAAFASQCLTAGQQVLALADTSWTGPLLTASPHDYYPESEWRDDVELGAVEIATAERVFGDDSSAALAEAAHWAAAYISGPNDGGDSLNLYDVSALAHADLAGAIATAGDPPGLEVTRTALVNDMQRQLKIGVRKAGRTPFGPGGSFDDDPVPHMFGLAITAAAYDRLTGTDQYAALGRAQLGFALGANPWGTSFVIGAGSTFPDCPQHQVANLAGSLDGHAPVLLGATPDGPNSPSVFKGLGLPDGARKCPPDGSDPYAAFTGHGGRYLDDVVAWPSVEPADDYTALSMLAFVAAASGGP